MLCSLSLAQYHFLTPLQINHLHLNLVLRIFLWGNPNQNIDSSSSPRNPCTYQPLGFPLRTNSNRKFTRLLKVWNQDFNLKLRFPFENEKCQPAFLLLYEACLAAPPLLICFIILRNLGRRLLPCITSFIFFVSFHSQNRKLHLPFWKLFSI